ncbi:MAG: response regulator transcription factor [Lachnospiraceae bacterium]|nr:response regulator transcription factor [Lachnospiraceae bacterium]
MAEALIYIVEDDRNIREIESFALKNSGYEIREFETAKQFYAGLAAAIPQLVLLDIMLPEEDGLSILQKIRQNRETARTPVIMVTAKSSEMDKVRGLDHGADDYITKPFGVLELISRVKALLRRSETTKEATGQTRSCIELGRVILDDDRYLVTVAGEPCDLTYKEFELLRYLMQNNGIVLSRSRIMERVWGEEYEGETRTVDMHIKTLRQKLKGAGGMIKTVRNVGYMMEADPQTHAEG